MAAACDTTKRRAPGFPCVRSSLSRLPGVVLFVLLHARRWMGLACGEQRVSAYWRRSVWPMTTGSAVAAAASASGRPATSPESRTDDTPEKAFELCGAAAAVPASETVPVKVKSGRFRNHHKGSSTSVDFHREANKRLRLPGD